MKLSSIGIHSKVKNQQTLDVNTVIAQFADFFTTQGLIAPSPIYADGKIHRFSTKQNNLRDSAGWYVLLIHGSFIRGVIGDWRSDIELTWTPNGQISPDKETWDEIQKYQEDLKRQRLEANAKAMVDAQTKLASLPAATDNNAYLLRKKIPADGNIREENGVLYIPVLNEKQEICSYQKIWGDGKKRFLLEGRTQGCFYYVMPKKAEETSTVFLCEGYATAMSIMQATDMPVFIAFSAGNLSNCVNTLRNSILNRNEEIIIIADNDESLRGEKEAKKTGCRYVVIPEKGMDANDYVNAGYNLKQLLSPFISDNELQDLMAEIDKPEPIEWHIKHWIPKEALCMTIGRRGGGKTFLIIDWLMTIASGLPYWYEPKFKVNRGCVVYLCGEGVKGIKKRAMGWMISHNIRPQLNSFYVFKNTVNFESVEGYSHLVSKFEKLGINPDLICFDTLNRYFRGNENKADESGWFIDNAEKLIRKYMATILLIHHVGNDKEAQERGRGSSAWEGAADAIFLVEPDKDNYFTLKQTKMKDDELISKPISLKLEKVALPETWNDEDGEVTTTAYVSYSKKSDLMDKEKESSTVLLSDEQELKEMLKDFANVRVNENKQPYFSKKAWRESMRKRGWADYDIKNFFRIESYRPLMRLITAKVIIDKEGKITVISNTVINWWIEWLEQEKNKSTEGGENSEEPPF